MQSLFLVPLMFVAGVAFATDGLGTSSDASAEPAGHAQGTAQPADEFSTFDTDHDGVLSQAEMRRHPKAAHMAMVDENRDGVLSRGEFAELSDM